MITRNKGAEDVMPGESYIWQRVEQMAADIAGLYGFREIRFPTFEKTELFVRSVGETTDVVQKEMWTVKGRESSYTLRPEGTAGCMRAVLQNGLLNESLPQKLWYQISAFRHENVQKGRLWEFHQFGAEMVGAAAPSADAEVIAFARVLLDSLGLDDAKLHINSIGCPECRQAYYDKLREYFEPNKDKLCATCQSRLDKNPMRILDCKSAEDKAIAKDAPMITDYLCDECRAHFDELKALLDGMGIAYEVDQKIVRGLDYYTRTVFEFISDSIGAQSTILGGGRYDKLLGQMGGPETPALGFAMGMERVILAMKAAGFDFGEPSTCDLYIASMGDAEGHKAAILADALRKDGFRVETELCGRGFKAQMKYANKIRAKYLLVIGGSELETGKANIKNMKTGEQIPVDLEKDLAQAFMDTYVADRIDIECGDAE
ncbi:MAG: histidine--tRNA ligase [Oscillospiraceae bacterium]|nr:histidine--tRNA ligase [Oscillospiraceae bacterium]